MRWATCLRVGYEQACRRLQGVVFTKSGKTAGGIQGGKKKKGECRAARERQDGGV